MENPDAQYFSRPPWERMMRIHQLLNEQAYPKSATVAKEFEVSWRTILRDVEFMKSRLNLPIEFCKQRKGFYYTQPVDQFPQLPFNQAEVFAMLIAHKAIAQYRGTPFEQPLELAYRRLVGQLDTTAKFGLSNLNDGLSFRPFAPEDTDLATFEILTRAVSERRVLQFQYRNLGAEAFQTRVVHPYHLACVDNHWYLFAHDVKRDAMRTFALPRLQAPAMTGETFTIRRDFNLNDYLRGSLSVFKGNQDLEIVLDFDAWAADLIRGRKWHASQTVTELPARRLRLQMRLNAIEEAERWILSWGDHATVVSPRSLAHRVRSIATAIQALYADLPLE